MRALLTGAAGQVGSEITQCLLQHGIETIAATSSDLDITKRDNVIAAICDTKCDVVINAAAYTAVDRAQTEQEKAFDINVRGCEYLAKGCAMASIPLIHLSTDYVFSLPSGMPHFETDRASPNGVYAKTKYEGERRVLGFNQRSIVLRCSWVFGRYGSNFVKTMLRLGMVNDKLSVVCDQMGSPTPARAIAGTVVDIAKIICTDKSFNDYGIYHYAGAPYTTWDEFARVIFKRALELGYIDHEVVVKSIKSHEYKFAIDRPLDSRLDCTLIKKIFNIDMPSWDQYLDETLEAQYKAMT